MPNTKPSTSYRLSDEARELLARLAKKYGLNQTAVLEQAIRKLALAEGVANDDRS